MGEKAFLLAVFLKSCAFENTIFIVLSANTAIAAVKKMLKTTENL